MKRLIVATLASMAISSPAAADTPAHDVEAREIFERIIGFRTAAGQGQMTAMVAVELGGVK